MENEIGINCKLQKQLLSKAKSKKNDRILMLIEMFHKQNKKDFMDPLSSLPFKLICDYFTKFMNSL